MTFEKLIGRMTPEETQQLLRECIEALTDEMLLEVLKEKLTMDQIDELRESLP